jgi:hypothetical protein
MKYFWFIYDYLKDPADLKSYTIMDSSSSYPNLEFICIVKTSVQFMEGIPKPELEKEAIKMFFICFN